METTFKVLGLSEQTGQSGKKYWSVDTDKGKMTAFDEEIVKILKANFDKEISMNVEENDRGFKNIRAKKNGQQALTKPAAVAAIETASESKRQLEYTRMAIDIYLEIRSEMQITNIPEEEKLLIACDLVKSAREQFK